VAQTTIDEREKSVTFRFAKDKANCEGGGQKVGVFDVLVTFLPSFYR